MVTASRTALARMALNAVPVTRALALEAHVAAVGAGELDLTLAPLISAGDVAPTKVILAWVEV